MRIAVIWILVILAVAALRETRAFTMPLGVGLFLAALAWPLQKQLERKLPPSASLSITLLVFWVLLALFGAALVLCANAIADGAADYEAPFIELIGHVKNWLTVKGVPAEFLQVDPTKTMERAIQLVASFALGMYDVLGLLVLIAVYFFLALLEVHTFTAKLELGRRIPHGHEFLAAAGEVATSIQQFMMARTLISLGVGVLTMLFTWIIGLDFVVVWGVTAFLLNYIPVFGAIVAVTLPTLLALIQPEAAWLAPSTCGGLLAIHVLLGNYLDPWIQGRYLSLSPLILFFSVTFWGWVWGIPGVLISVPLTATVIIVCKRFKRTKWIAFLLSKGREPVPSLNHVPAPASPPERSQHRAS